MHAEWRAHVLEMLDVLENASRKEVMSSSNGSFDVGKLRAQGQADT